MEARCRFRAQTDFLGRQLEEFKVNSSRLTNGCRPMRLQSGLVMTSDKDDLAEKKLDDLQTALSKAQAERIAAQSRYEMAVKSPLEIVARSPG